MLKLIVFFYNIQQSAKKLNKKNIFYRLIRQMLRKKNNKAVFIAILLAILTCAALYTIKSGNKVYNYYSLTIKVPVQKINFSIKKISANKYILCADYNYLFNKNLFHVSEDLFSTLSFSLIGAEKNQNEMEKEQHGAWINHKKPATGTLFKKFPTKDLIHTGIIWAILLYFCGLAYYLKSQKL